MRRRTALLAAVLALPLRGGELTQPEFFPPRPRPRGWIEVESP
jgi:hypothetical protein